MRVIRRSVFETNSSSTHSLTMVSKDEYDKWKNGETFLNYGDFYTKEEAIKNLKNDKWFNKYYPDFDFSNEDAIEDALKDHEYYTYDYYWDIKSEEYETFSNSYKTSSGEEVIAFGYYGYDG